MIRTVSGNDSKEIVEIYNHYVETSIVTFETELVSGDQMAGRIDALVPSYPWIVYITNDRIQGYAYLSSWKTRSAYNNSAEVSVYVRPGMQGQGIGKALLQDLIDKAEEMNIHCLLGGIALPNDSSIGLHEKFGFEKKVAQFKEVGRKFDKWIDVGYWELIL